jgi:hypothetical protein
MCTNPAWRRVTGFVALLAMLVGTYGSIAHTAGDLDCAIPALHDASAHRFTAPATPETTSPPLHCLACHWARTFRPRAEPVYLAAPACEARAVLPIEAVSHLSASIAAQPPLRSPPALSPALL